MSLVKRALKDRYVTINKKKDSVIYLPQGKERKLSNPEEQVQLETYLDLIYQYKYPPEKLRVCEQVKIGSESREADIVVYRDRECKDPYIIVECKKRKISEKVFEGAIDQGFSYAAATTAEYVWATSGDRSAAFEVFHSAIHEREHNRMDRIPKHKEEQKTGYSLRRKWRWLVNHPIVTDTFIYAIILLLSTIAFSKLAVEFHGDIYETTRFLWEKHGMDFNWIFNGIVVLSTLFSMVFGMVFMRSHRFFETSKVKKRITLTMIGLILFVPAWYIGTSNSDPGWWTSENFHSRKYPIIIYLWPYVKSMAFQIAAIYGLIWLMGRGKK